MAFGGPVCCKSANLLGIRQVKGQKGGIGLLERLVDGFGGMFVIRSGADDHKPLRMLTGDFERCIIPQVDGTASYNGGTSRCRHVEGRESLKP